METDLHLLSRYHRHGDTEAFQSLVEAHAGMVHATARRITRDAALAQDVAQETFLALARSSGAAIQSVGAWLHHVAWQKAQNIVRGESRRHRYEAVAAEQMNRPSDETTWAELEPLLDEVLVELPEAVRAILIERYIEGRSQQELAVRVGVSQSTISRKLDAAVSELRSRLQVRGVLCGGGLTMLLSAHGARAAPASLKASLGKIALSGTGSSAAVASGSISTSTFLAMTTTTKILLATASVAVFMSVPWALQHLSGKQAASGARQPPSAPSPAADSAQGHKAESVATVRHYRPAPVTMQVHQAVEAIIRRHQGMSKQELQRSAELNQFMDRFIAMINSPEMQAKIEQRLAVITPMKGAEHGTLMMDFDLLDDARGRAWLEAAVSGNAQLMEDWILNTLDGAIFEFAFDPLLEKSSNGVSVQPADAPRPATQPRSDD